MAGDEPPMPDLDDPRVERAMVEMERDMEHLDENNPKHMAHMMKKMKDLMPPGTMPKEMDIAIKRLEAGEDPEKIEADMGDVLGDFMGGGRRRGAVAVTRRTADCMITKGGREVKTACFTFEGLSSFATSLNSYYLYFYLRDQFGFDDQETSPSPR